MNIHIPVNSTRHIEMLGDRQALTTRALDLVVAAYHNAIATTGRFTFVASGGSTPKSLYELLAKQNLDWQKFHVFWGDERYVPVTDSQSNEGMTRRTWLDHIEIPEANIHPIPTLSDDPELDAARYSQHIQGFFQTAAPIFDLILLGLGDDGHTASLFPHTAALTVGDRLVTVGQKDGQPRLTFTVPLINSAKEILFLVPSANKETAINAVMAETESSSQYPARLIRTEATWLIC